MKARTAGRSVAALLAFLLPAGVGADPAPSSGVRFVPTSYAVALGEAPDPLPQSKLIEAALVLSGADADTVAGDEERMQEIIGELGQALEGVTDPYARGNRILEFMHSRLLRQYLEPQARLDTLLQSGEFNCVSSAVLYMILARQEGLDVEGVSTPDHAFCTVDLGDRVIDVETTNTYGFDPGQKKDFKNAFGQTGFTYVPPGNYQLRTATNDKGLLSFILQDRISVLEQERDFADAVGLAVDRSAVLKTPQAFNDGATEISNYLSTLNDEGEYSQALSLLQQAETSYGQASALAKIGAALYHNQVVALDNSGDYADAMAVLSTSAAQAALGASDSASLRQSTAENELQTATRTLPFAQALAAVTSSYEAGDIPKSLFDDYVVSLYGQQAQAAAAQNDFLKGAGLIDQAIALAGDDSRLVQARDVLLNNYGATVHNQFAELYNAGRTDDAIAVLKKGLEAVPGNPLLTSDLEKAEAAK